MKGNGSQDARGGGGEFLGFDDLIRLGLDYRDLIELDGIHPHR